MQTVLNNAAWKAYRRFAKSSASSIAIAFTIGSCLSGCAHASDGAKLAPSPWWKGAVIYEIYPRGLQDSNGDGIGDLKGIIERLYYLQSLHVNAIWLTPIYPSPQVDFGYDISNYEKIDPMYGTMQDFDRLIAEAGKRHIRVVMDLVLNHTSDQNPWFIESRSSRTNSKADWYIWRDGKDARTPPNNWLSLFGGSAWQWDPVRKQFYYHRFYKQQPDLNWRNPEVEKAMFDVCRFWLNRGVAGFRLDAVPAIYEDPQLRDAAILPGKNAFGDPKEDQSRYMNLPEVHPLMQRLRALLNSYPGDRVLIGETNLPIQQLRAWYGKNGDELQLPMDMQLGFATKLDADLLRSRLEEAETQLDGNMPLFVFDNHDRRRSWDRFGDGSADSAAIARIIATILLMSRDTALLYYGQAIGMVTTPPTSIDQVQDPIGRTGWPKEKGRDGERTPMQWNAGKDAGFSSAAKPWLPIPPSAQTVNVATELHDHNSLLNWYRSLLDLRASREELRLGSMQVLNGTADGVLAFTRSAPEQRTILVAMNISGQARQVRINQLAPPRGNKRLRILLQDGSLPERIKGTTFTLSPYTSVIAELQP